MSESEPEVTQSPSSSGDEDVEVMEEEPLVQVEEGSGDESAPKAIKKKKKEFVPRRIYAHLKKESKGSYKPKPRSNKVSTTKYSIFTFLPKNLFEQFRRLANFYFLFVALITLTPWSPSSPVANWLPLIGVLSVTGIKEAVEDILRWKSDNEINRRKSLVFGEGPDKKSLLKKTQWKKIRVGDIVKVENRGFFPCDLILLSSSEEEGMAYVETSNLDGETNLKIKQAAVETADYTSEEEIGNLRARLDCEHPNPRLYQFEGTLYLPNKEETCSERFHEEVLHEDAYTRSIPLGEKQILLRGSVLRNTKFIYGLAVFTGKQTKLMMNATKTPAKRSNVEKKTNYYLISIFIIHFGLCFLFALAGAIFQCYLHGDDPYLLLSQEDSWAPVDLPFALPFVESIWDSLRVAIIGEKTINLARFLPYQVMTRFLTFIALFSIMIPISLYVTMELVKIALVWAINNDINMYHEETDTPASARTSNLHEELGQVNYIFSDKTGTLTCNIMEFARCSVGATVYGNEKSMAHLDEIKDIPTETGSQFVDKEILYDLEHSEGGMKRKIDEFLSLLSTCHTVIPEVDVDDETKIIYQAASPDEAALVIGAKCLGYNFHSRTPSDITVGIMGTDHKFNILNVLEFNSTRKRMSVVVRDHRTREIKLYTKGADTMIMARLDEEDSWNNATIEPLNEKLEQFASQGLRTLVLAYRVLNEEEYTKWSAKYHEACCSLVDREEKIDAACEQIERNLILVGSTAIEDKLQDGVPDTIAKLADAGIKVWVLTGDKQETAINIGFSCKLLHNDMERMIVSEASAEATVKRLSDLLETHQPSKDVDYGLIIDGGTLLFALDKAVKSKLLKLARMCKAVICCRVSPKQKMDIVKLVRNNVKCTSLAIGDGANDVPMIQAAHIGVGISGQEGLQAVRSSDYSIAQFRFLQHLLLVHGNWSYRRISLLIIYSFYKNMYLALVKAWFNVVNGFSGQLMIDAYLSTFYNVIFTLMPIIIYGVYDKANTENQLLKYPQLYQNGLKNKSFNLPRFLVWLVVGFLQSIATFWLPILVMYQHSINGMTYDFTALGNLVYGIVIIVANAKIALNTHSWTPPTAVFLVGSVAAYFVVLVVYCFPRLPFLRMKAEMEFSWFNLLISPQYYLLMLLVPAVCILPELAIKFLWEWWFPRDEIVVRQMHKKGKFLRPWKKKDYRYFGGQFRHRGFAFSSEYTGGKLPKRFFKRLDEDMNINSESSVEAVE